MTILEQIRGFLRSLRRAGSEGDLGRAIGGSWTTRRRSEWKKLGGIPGYRPGGPRASD